MFFNIKDKFRFVTVSLLLGSLVTVISSASAAVSGPIAFSFDVTDCTVDDTSADWMPDLADGTDNQIVDPGDLVSVTAVTGLSDGTSGCADGSMDVTGEVTSELDITDAPGINWNESTDCPAPIGCPAVEGLQIDGDFVVPAESSGTYSGAISLTWTP